MLRRGNYKNRIHFFFLSQFISLQTEYDSLALKLIRCVTLQVAVRSVSIQQRQEAVGLQVARPLMRVWGENTSVPSGGELKELAEGSLQEEKKKKSSRYERPPIVLTFPVIAYGYFLSQFVVTNAKHRLLHVIRKYPLQVVCVCEVKCINKYSEYCSFHQQDIRYWKQRLQLVHYYYYITNLFPE